MHCVLDAVTAFNRPAVSGRKQRRTPIIPTPPPVYPANVPKPKPTQTLKNILYLVADDMRPQLHSYGHEYMITPNLDKLAATGLQFDFAYTQFAYCAPSRNSFMSGRRPARTRVINFLSTFRTRSVPLQRWKALRWGCATRRTVPRVVEGCRFV